MPAELYLMCDECTARLDDGDPIFCEGCWEKQKDYIEELEQQVAKLEGELEDLRNQ